VPLVYCRIRIILHIYPQQPVPKTDCQLSRRSILDSLGNHIVGIKTTGEQISILCHNGTIFDKPRVKTGLAIKRHVGVRENPAGP
jgi:hypothetical protein